MTNCADPDEEAQYEPSRLVFTVVNSTIFIFGPTFGPLTLKAPNKNCSKRHLNFLLLSLDENKT